MTGTVLRDVSSGDLAVVSVTVQVHKPRQQSLQMQVCVQRSRSIYISVTTDVGAVQCAVT